ncbi:MAG: hypothetical protein AB1758_35835 [Candidatus Eremiobacterota bacterium]
MRRWASVLALLALVTLPAAAQILLVSGSYRVVKVDPEKHRFAVAVPAADPDIRQNWCYLDLSTRMVRRTVDADGWHRDEELEPHQILQALQKGDRIYLEGGRNWDLSIHAKRIYLPAELWPELH